MKFGWSCQIDRHDLMQEICDGGGGGGGGEDSSQ